MNLLFLAFEKSILCLENLVNHTGNLFCHLTFTTNLLPIIRVYKGERMRFVIFGRGDYRIIELGCSMFILIE